MTQVPSLVEGLNPAPTFLQRLAMPPLRVCTVLVGLTVPISVALDNLLLALVSLGILFNARAVWQIARQHPVARSALMLFFAMSVGIFYGATPLREAAGTLGKYVDLAFIPLFMLILSNDAWRRWAQHAFTGAMGLTLLLSYLIGLKFMLPADWMYAATTPEDPAIFHSHITQNNMMAFAVFLALLNWREAVSGGVKIAWGLFALLGAINVLFMVQGRSGYMILLVLLVWFAWVSPTRYMYKHGKPWGWRQAVVVELVLLVLIAGIYSISPRMHDRIGLVSVESKAWQADKGSATSTGQRLDFYKNTLQIAKQNPVLGVGTGGFPAAFALQIQGSDILPTHNPHNEYLMIAVQTGLAGLLLLLYLFYTQWRYAPLLNSSLEQDAARGLVLAYMVNCLFNSALLDHSDGLLFAFMTAVLFSNSKAVKHD